MSGFILGRNAREDSLIAKAMWFLMLAIFAANIAFSVDALMNNAMRPQIAGGFTPLISRPGVGIIFAIVICVASSGFCWLVAKTFVTNPFALPLITKQAMTLISGQGGIGNIATLALSTIILVAIGYLAVLFYRFDLLTTSIGLGIPITWKVYENPLEIAVLGPVFMPEIISVVLSIREGINGQLPGGGGGGRLGGGGLV
jgi:hypothetical protein